jgi:hypothetical protein
MKLLYKNSHALYFIYKLYQNIYHQLTHKIIHKQNFIIVKIKNHITSGRIFKPRVIHIYHMRWYFRTACDGTHITRGPKKNRM